MSDKPDNMAPARVPADGSGRSARWISVVVLGVLVAIFVGQGARIAAMPTAKLVSWNVVIDDGFYYLQIARNLARGHGSTFDRINRTNGYHPLWAWALVPVFWLTDDPDVGMKTVIVLATLLGGLSLILLFWGIQRLAGLGSALLVCALIASNPSFLEILQTGLETPLLFFCLACLVAYWALRGELVLAGQRRCCIILGVILAAIVLARVDASLILLPFCLLLVLWGGGGLRPRLRRATWIAAPALIILLPYVLYNWIVFGHPVPVSGLIKAWVAAKFTPNWEHFVFAEQWRGVTRTLHAVAWPWQVTERQAFDNILSLLILPGVMVGALALRLVWSRRARRNRLAILLFSGAVVGVVGHGLYMFFVVRSCGHWNHHYFFAFALVYSALLCLPLPLLMADLGLLLDQRLSKVLRRGFAALGAALCLPLVAYLVHEGLLAADRHYRHVNQLPWLTFRKIRLDEARHLGERYPPDTVFGAWWAGTLGYFSDCKIVNLDGVVNSGEYFRKYIRGDSVPVYLLDGPISYIADYFWRDPLRTTAGYSWRIFWWEYEKHHLAYRMRDNLQIVHRSLFRQESGFYVMKVIKDSSAEGADQ